MVCVYSPAISKWKVSLTVLVILAGCRLGFNGADLTKVGLAVGNGHYNVALPFNAGKGFHRYDMIWGNGTAELYVDGIQMSMTPPLKPSDVPTTPMNLMIDTCVTFTISSDCGGTPICSPRRAYTHLIPIPCRHRMCASTAMRVVRRGVGRS